MTKLKKTRKEKRIDFNLRLTEFQASALVQMQYWYCTNVPRFVVKAIGETIREEVNNDSDNIQLPDIPSDKSFFCMPLSFLQSDYDFINNLAKSKNTTFEKFISYCLTINLIRSYQESDDQE